MRVRPLYSLPRRFVFTKYKPTRLRPLVNTYLYLTNFYLEPDPPIDLKTVHLPRSVGWNSSYSFRRAREIAVRSRLLEFYFNVRIFLWNVEQAIFVVAPFVLYKLFNQFLCSLMLLSGLIIVGSAVRSGGYLTLSQ